MNPLRGGIGDLKDRYINETEQLINTYREKQERLKAEIVLLEEQEQEARAMLQLLRMGKVVTKKQVAKEVKRVEVSDADFMAAIEMQDYKEFTAQDIADITGQSSAHTSKRLNNLVGNVLRVTKESTIGVGGRTPVYYKQLRPKE